LGKSFYYCSEANVAFDITLDYPRGNPALTSLVVFKSPYTEPQQIFSGPEITSIPLGQSQSSIDVSEQYLIAGVEHILVGYDHLLFILCLMIIASGFKRLLLTVTGFTVAHSITLSLASLNIIRVRTELVELLIALSILLLAVEIIKHYRVKNYESFTWRYPITASSVFGLLHGFGFAVVLQELGLPQSMKIHALLFFNIGVEIGQIMFISGMAILGYFVSKFLLKISVKREIFVQFAVYVIGISSAYWLFERTSAIFL
jgi:hydrogenase/urease accessory protein HupE